MTETQKETCKGTVIVVCVIAVIAFIVFSIESGAQKKTQKAIEVKNEKIEAGTIIVGSDGSEWESITIDGCEYLRINSRVSNGHGTSSCIPFFIHRAKCPNHK